MSDRVSLRYVNADDPTPVALAGFLEAEPSIVSPGDVFTVPRSVADTMLRPAGDDEDAPQADQRWALVSDDDEVDAYPDLTVEQMHERAAAIADRAVLDAPETPRTRAESAAILADLELRYPPVPEQPTQSTAIGDAPDTLSADAEGDTADEQEQNR